MPLARKAASALPAAQPLTYPDGSNPPGTAHGSNHPSDRSRAAAHRVKYLGYLRRDLRAEDFSPPQPADRAVGPPGTEGRVDVVQNCHRFGELPADFVAESLRGIVRVDVDDHDRAHHLFQVVDDVDGLTDLGGAPRVKRPSLDSAPWSDCWNPWLV